MRAGRCQLFATLLAVTLSGCVDSGPLGLMHGHVLDARTREAIPDATVTVQCMRRLHSLELNEELLTEVAVRSDKNGSYHVPSDQRAHCYHIGVSAEKRGYVRSVKSTKSTVLVSNLPYDVFLVPESAATMDILIDYSDELARVKGYNGGRNVTPVAHETLHVYAAFIGSKRVARTPEEISFVKRSYCRRLISLRARLSESDKQYLAGVAINDFHHTRYLYEEEVEPFCNSPIPER